MFLKGKVDARTMMFVIVDWFVCMFFKFFYDLLVCGLSDKAIDNGA